MGSILRMLVLGGFAAGFGAGPLSGAAFADDAVAESPVDRAFHAAIGARYWFSTGETSKDLYDVSGSFMVSRLTYDDLDTHSGELFGEVGASRLFLKGFAGLGGIVDGNLQDEDFPPAITPYSSTDSEQHDGDLAYATIDVGAYLLDSQHARLGGFVGYNFMHQKVSAFGCTQTETNPDVCVPEIPTSVAVITQENDWHSLRVGLNGAFDVTERLSLSGNGAWLPYVKLDGADSHLLRICDTAGCFTGPVPEDGEGWGYQLEGMLEYGITDRIDLGLGGRYWHMETSGETHFEDHVVGFSANPQPVDWSVDIFGVLAQAKVHF